MSAQTVWSIRMLTQGEVKSRDLGLNLQVPQQHIEVERTRCPIEWAATKQQSAEFERLAQPNIEEKEKQHGAVRLLVTHQCIFEVK